MTPQLRNMLVAAGVLVISAGVGARFYLPTPSTRTLAELRDAGIGDGQTLPIICSEQTTKQTRNRISQLQPSAFRPKQVYSRVARLTKCFNPDGGNCLRPSNGLVRVANLEADLVGVSLRVDLTGVDLDAGLDDAGESNVVDDSLPFRLDACDVMTCTQADAMEDAGTFINPYAPSRFCAGLNRVAAQPLPCMLPLCLGSDGGWDDKAVVDCRGVGPYGEQDGGPRWRGCNVTPVAYAVGSACVPTECGVVGGGDIAGEWK